LKNGIEIREVFYYSLNKRLLDRVAVESKKKILVGTKYTEVEEQMSKEFVSVKHNRVKFEPLERIAELFWSNG
jgi:preprotein translocase subunit SecA